MADDGSIQSAGAAGIWPLVKFQFGVTVGGVVYHFSEVTGLSAETQIIEYRAGTNALYSVVKMPGIAKYPNVVFKKGMFRDDTAAWDLYHSIRMNTFKREIVVINLLDEAGAPVMTWTLNNCFPVKMTFTDMKADANESAIETLEMAYEQIIQTKE
jgi:phage tail-like protein